MNLFTLKCPARICTYLNNNHNDGLHQIQSISDTIDIYDEVSLSFSTKSHIPMIYLNNKLMIGENIISKTINFFYEYTNIEMEGIVIHINKKIPFQIDLNNLDCIAASILIALNINYHLNYTQQQLIELSSLISKNIPQYILGGYQIRYNDGQIDFEEIGNHYDNYLIVLSNRLEPWIISPNQDGDKKTCQVDNQFYNYLESQAPQELLALKQMLINYSATNICINGISNSLIAFFESHHDRFRVREKLKDEKIKTIICRPCSGILVERKFVKSRRF